MANRVNKIEPYIPAYQVERSAYRLDNQNKIVHLRMLSPDNGKTHVEFFSYIIERGIDVLTTKIENDVLRKMEQAMDEKIGNEWNIKKRQIAERLKGVKQL